MSLTLSVSKTLPKLASKKLLKKAPANNDTQSHCLAVLVDDKANLIGNFKGLEAYQQRIEDLIAVSDFSGKLGETVADFALSADAKKAPLQLLLLVGVGKPEKINSTSIQKIATALYKNTHKRVTNLAVAIGDDLSEESLQQLALELLNASYRFDKYKAETSEPKLSEVTLVSASVSQETVDYVAAVHSGQSLARDVANEPGNICFPAYMADQAKELAKAYPDLLKVTVLGESEMEELGMNCFLSVSRGSVREGQLVILEYQGQNQAITNSGSNSFTGTLANNIKAVADKLPKKAAKAKKVDADAESVEENFDAPIVLVGKGVTFDSGGISIKPGAAMDEMKFDMGGSASVLGTIKALCEARLPINVVGALACAENMPSGEATRPGDIVKAMNGMNVEILNTDAEGRLVLADTLCYVQRYNPRAIIDVATLTGACVIALGHVRSAVFSNDEDVLFELENASDQSGDLIWHMPLDDQYQSQLDSPIADIQNIGGRAAGAVTAACFLSRFIEEDQAWAHLDIAGTAWNSGKEKGATGRPVPLFMQYLKNMSQQ